MAFVGMEDLRRRVPSEPAERAYRPHATDAKQQLLPESVVAAAAVEPVGDLTQGGVVLLHVGIEQQQRNPAHLREPDLGGEHAARVQGDG